MTLQQVSTAFAALGDPTRLAIMARLSQGEATVTELASPFPISMPAITKHLKVLENAGLISRSRDAQWRPCRIEGRGLKPVADWVEQYRAFWEESFDRLDLYLQSIQQPKKPHTKGKRNVRKKQA
jgi:DNA-binding transcriptional ArsR family regulator